MKKLKLKSDHLDKLKKSKKKDKKKDKDKKGKKKILTAPKSKKKEAKNLRKVYEKQQCAFHNGEGKRCTKNAYGSSTLCKKHGGKVSSKDLIRLEDIDTDVSVLTKYDPAKHPMAYINLSRQGLTEVEIAAQFSVSIGTLRSWSEKYVDFNTAYEVGQVVSEAYYVAVGRDNFDNTRFNTSLFKFITGNKLGWSEKTESKSFNMNVHGVLVAPAEVPLEQWAENTQKLHEENQKKAQELFDGAIDADYSEVK